MKNVIDAIGDVVETRQQNSSVLGNAVALQQTEREEMSERGVADRVALQLDHFPNA